MSDLKNLKFYYEYDRKNPFEVTFRFSNPNNMDLFMCTYFTAFDPAAGQQWKITNQDGTVGRYQGEKADRDVAENNPGCWKLLKAGGKVEKNGRLEYGCDGKEFKLECTVSDIRACTKKDDDGKPVNVFKLGVDIEEKRL